MNKQKLLFLALAAAVVVTLIRGLGSDPDYTIGAGSRERPHADLDSLRRQTEVDPNSAMNWSELAVAYLLEAKATGNREMADLAKEAADHVLQFDSPYRKNATLVMAEVSVIHGDFKEAEERLEKLPSDVAADPDVLALRVRVEIGLGRANEAKKDAETLVDKKHTTETLRLRGLARENSGNVDGAERDLIAAIGLEEKADLTTAIENRFELAKFYFLKGDLERARHVLSAVMKVSEEPRLLGLLGRIEFAAGNYDKAKSALDKAFQNGRDPVWLLEEADVEKARGKTDEAGSANEFAVELTKVEMKTPETARPLVFARALLANARPGELDLARAVLEKEIAHRRDPETLALAARVALAKGEKEKASPLIAELRKTSSWRRDFSDLLRAI